MEASSAIVNIADNDSKLYMIGVNQSEMWIHHLISSKLFYTQFDNRCSHWV
jgi:hypothetical protein